MVVIISKKAEIYSTNLVRFFVAELQIFER
jgi:hypothetical protein